MARIKLELNTSKTNADGRHPIYITVTKVKQRAYLTIGSATVDEWDDSAKRIKKGRKHYVADNIFIEDEFYRYKKIFDEMDPNGRWEPKDVFNAPKRERLKLSTLYEYADAYLESIEDKKGTLRYMSDESRIKKIKRFAHVDDMVSDIDDYWISKFVVHCKTKERNNDGGMGNSKNTINHTLKLLKKIVRFSKQPAPDLMEYKLNYDQNVKNKLTEPELQKIIKLDLKYKNLLYHTRNIFLAQFYLRGMRVGDVLRLKKSDVKDGKIFYTTGKSKVVHQIKLVEACAVLLGEYLEGEGYLFPFIRNREYDTESLTVEVKNRTSIINRNLKKLASMAGIDKNISSHIARHTFASIADKKLGGDLKDLQAMLGHSSRTMTEIYIRDLRKYDEMDDVADKVFD